jgi:hypothetical protein
VGLRKIAGVDTVKVTLNDGMARIRLKPGNDLPYERVLEVVFHKGFTPKDAQVTVVGELVAAEGKTRFRVRGSDQTFDVTTAAQAEKLKQELKKQMGKTVQVEGTIPPPRDKETPAEIRVTSVLPVNQEGQ